MLKQDSKQEPDKVPAHMKTAALWAREEDLSHPHARRLIQQLVTDGKWEAKKYRVDSVRGLYPMVHYGPRKQAGKAPR